MSQQDRPSTEEIARRFLLAKTNTVQALADELGIKRQSLHQRVKSFLERNPGFEERVLSEAREGAA